MLFNSYGFIFLFLPLSVLGFHLLARSTQGKMAFDWLIGLSFVFYSWENPENFPILLGSLLGNHAIARAMGADDATPPAMRTNHRRGFLLFLGIAFNLLLLGYYKYFSQLPLGISFFTLTQVMYLVDCYQGVVPPATFREQALLAAFFPTVSMGPLLRAREMTRQLDNPATLGLNARHLAQALFLFSIGLCKKTVIADSFSRLADAGHASTASLSMMEAWVSSAAFTLQIYYDFSGYSDMAVATALLFGIRIPINFNSPYQARSIVDFWMRWHISLSNFITTYLYTPIIRSFRKITFAKAMFATFAAMMIAGIWHGSSLNFMIFGALHGLGLIVNQLRKKNKKPRLPAWLAWFVTILYINLAFIFFRADTVPHAWEMIASLVNTQAPFSNESWHRSSLYITSRLDLLIPIIMGVLMIFHKKNSNQLSMEFMPTWKNLLLAATAMLTSLVSMNTNVPKEFLYFNF